MSLMMNGSIPQHVTPINHHDPHATDEVHNARHEENAMEGKNDDLKKNNQESKAVNDAIRSKSDHEKQLEIDRRRVVNIARSQGEGVEKNGAEQNGVVMKKIKKTFSAANKVLDKLLRKLGLKVSRREKDEKDEKNRKRKGKKSNIKLGKRSKKLKV